MVPYNGNAFWQEAPQHYSEFLKFGNHPAQRIVMNCQILVYPRRRGRSFKTRAMSGDYDKLFVSENPRSCVTSAARRALAFRVGKGRAVLAAFMAPSRIVRTARPTATQSRHVRFFFSRHHAAAPALATLSFMSLTPQNWHCQSWNGNAAGQGGRFEMETPRPKAGPTAHIDIEAGVSRARQGLSHWRWSRPQPRSHREDRASAGPR
jgi:hypothetical protein